LAILSEDGSVCVLSVSLGVCNNIKNDVRTAQLAWPALYSEGGDRLPPATIPNRGSLAGLAYMEALPPPKLMHSLSKPK